MLGEFAFFAQNRILSMQIKEASEKFKSNSLMTLFLLKFVQNYHSFPSCGNSRSGYIYSSRY